MLGEVNQICKGHSHNLAVYKIICSHQGGTLVSLRICYKEKKMKTALEPLACRWFFSTNMNLLRFSRM